MSLPEASRFPPKSTNSSQSSFQSETSPEPRGWIAGLPKVELHVHLEGSLSPSTVGLLAARHNIDTEEILLGSPSLPHLRDPIYRPDREGESGIGQSRFP